jgi:Bacterial Ig-like domain (group 3)
MQAKGRRTMARHLTRALGGIALVGASLALAACTSSAGSSGTGGAVQPGSSPPTKALSNPVKSGTVTVKEGGKVICVMTVVNGKGTCKVPASTIGTGTKTIVGDYSGTGYKPAQSLPLNVTVQSAATLVTLSVSPAKVTYGDEQVARVTVRVTASGRVPTGSVIVRSGATTICTIALSHGAGSCTLGAHQLKAGSRPLIARYGGDKSDDGSSSTVQKIVIAS